jgi:hypothetical protein
MTKVFLQPGLRGLSGKMGDWVYSFRKGKTYVGMVPINTSEPSAAQLAHRERFSDAADYAKFAITEGNPLREIYTLAAKERDIPAFALAVSDYLKLPVVKTLDLSYYNGQVGNIIPIVTSDDFGVTGVNVVIRDLEANILESGNASEFPQGSGHWNYVSTAAVPSGTTVVVYVTATDRPGGVGTLNVEKTID